MYVTAMVEVTLLSDGPSGYHQNQREHERRNDVGEDRRNQDQHQHGRAGRPQGLLANEREYIPRIAI
jgi:hypothetical protein